MTARTDLTVRPYKRENPPVLTDDVRLFVQRELARVEQTLRDLSEAAAQVADKAPTAPRRGTVRFAAAPWDPGAGDGPYVFNGTAWAPLSGGGGGVAPVSSVFGRTGAIVAASGDYSAFYSLTSHTHTITLSGDVTGSGTGPITATLANSGVTAGTYSSVTVDAKGRVTAGTSPKQWTQIASATLAANGTTLINQTGIAAFDFLRITIDLAGYSANDTIQLQCNGQTNGHFYHWKTESGHAAAGAAVSWVGGTNQATAASGIKLAPSDNTKPRGIQVIIPNRPEHAEKVVLVSETTGTGATQASGTAPQADICSASVVTAASTRITSVKLFTASQNMLAGTSVIIEGGNV